MPPTIPEKNQTKSSKNMKISTMMGGSRRLTLTYVVLAVWIALAIFAIIKDADLYGLAVYFASGLPLILGYLWSETSRPSIKDAADIIKNIGSGGRRREGVRQEHSGFGMGYGDYNDSGYSNYTESIPQSSSNSQSEYEDTSIYSDDASVELKVNQSQLTTLKNIGYVNSIGDKNTFNKSLLEQIKSLINDNGQQPTI